jgi:glycine cleavage system H protein
MADIPADVRYSRQHAWARQEPDGTVAVGVTTFVRRELGEIVYVQLPPLGDVLKAGDPAGTVETVEAAADVFAPVGGQVAEVNVAVEDDPGAINGDPYRAWLFKVRPSNERDYGDLLDATGYEALLDIE